MEKFCGIYKILNKINGKVYVGSSVHINKRLTNHKYALKANLHCNSYLQNSYNKHGKDNFLFEKVELCNFDMLIERENYYINLFNSNDLTRGYNLATVNDFRRNNFNEELKVKQSIFNLKLNGNFIRFKSINIITGEEKEFDSLVDAANYLIVNGFAMSKQPSLRQEISRCLRKKVKIKNDRQNPGERITVNKHKWIIIE